MDEPIWVTEATVTDIHLLQLDTHGGMAGLRDAGLLSSALFRPRNVWNYARDTADLASIAAAYAAGIARNHPFLDGNKRTAAVVCETFLNLNGMELAASDDEWYDAMIRLAAGESEESELAAWIRSHLRPLG